MECPEPPQGTATCSSFLGPISLSTIAPWAKRLPLPGMPSPYAFIITGFPMTSYLLNSENVRCAHREPVDSRSPRLNGPGPSDSITWSLPKDSVSGGRMAQAPCLPHGLFSGPVLAAVAASVPLPFPTPREILRPLRHAAISSHPSQYTSTPARYPKGTAILLLETPGRCRLPLQLPSLHALALAGFPAASDPEDALVAHRSVSDCLLSRWFRDVYRPARN